MVFDTDAITPVVRLVGHAARVWSIGFAPGDHIVTTSYDHSARVWDPSHSQLVANLPDLAVKRALFDPTGARVLTTLATQPTKVWDVRTRAPVAQLGVSARTGRFSPDGSRLVVAVGDELRVLDATTRLEVGSITGAGAAVDVDVGDHAAIVVWVTDRGAVFAWDGAGRRELAGDATSVRLDPRARRVVVSGPGSQARVIDVATGAVEATLEGHTNTVSSATFTPDGKFLVTSSWDTTARIWRLDGTVERTLGPAGDLVQFAAVTPDGERVITTHSGSTVKVWGLSSGHLLQTLYGHSRNMPVTYAEVSRDGASLLTVGDLVKVWNITSAPP
jgi:WD40 repeat protein